MYAFFKSSCIISVIVPDDVAVDGVDWSCGEGFVVGTFLDFGECELDVVIGGLMGPGLNSTLAFAGEGAIVWGLEASLDFEVVVGGVEKERAGRKKASEYTVVLRCNWRAVVEDVREMTVLRVVLNMWAWRRWRENWWYLQNERA
jgi:hypothetical protein